MEKSVIEDITNRLCGKTIVKVEASEWSGIVKSLTRNNGYVSLILDDGTVLEAGALFVREKEPSLQATQQN